MIWMHLRGALQTVGGPAAVQYLPQALALAVVLEFAPIAAGLIVAGRSGASLGAELGSMRLTEQIDALEVLGLSPLRELVAPRLLACMLALPLLDAVHRLPGPGLRLPGRGGGRQHVVDAVPQRVPARADAARRGAGHAQDGGVRLPDRRDRLLVTA